RERRSGTRSLAASAVAVLPSCHASSFAALAFQSICRALAHWQGPMWPRGEPQVTLRSFGSAFVHGVTAWRLRLLMGSPLPSKPHRGAVGSLFSFGSPV